MAAIDDVPGGVLPARHRPGPNAHPQAGEDFFDVVLVSGRAPASCAIKAVGYAHNSSKIFVSGWPRKFAPTVLRYYGLRRTIAPDGGVCRANEPRCLAALEPKPRYQGDKQAHRAFTDRFKNFARAPVNF